MAHRKYKFDKIKKVLTDRENEIYIIQDRYDPVTQEFKEPEERQFDPSIIPGRIAILQQEIDDLQLLKGRIDNKQFDEEVDKRERKDEAKDSGDISEESGK